MEYSFDYEDRVSLNCTLFACSETSLSSITMKIF